MKKLLLAALAAAIFLTLPLYAYANSAAWEQPSQPGFGPVPLKSNSIEVLSEDLTFDLTIQDKIEEFRGPDVARVTAEYRFKSSSDMAQTLSMAFPYAQNRTEASAREDVKVLFDGKDLKYSLVSITVDLFDTKGGAFDYYYKRLVFKDILAHMKAAGEQADTKKDSDRNKPEKFVEVILFEATFEPGAVHKMEVVYKQCSGGDRYDTRYYTNNYFYFLDPASYWKDFNDLDIKIIIPEGYTLFESNLELTRQKGGTGIYTGHFDKLPAENLDFRIYRSLNIIQKILEKISMHKVSLILIGVALLPALLILILVMFIIRIGRAMANRYGKL